MTYTIKSFKRTVQNRSMFRTDPQELWEAIITFENGDWIGVSQWHDEDYWVADCAFKENGYPMFSNGGGSRVTAVRCLAAEDITPLDLRRACITEFGDHEDHESCASMLGTMMDDGYYASYNHTTGQWDTIV